MAPPQDSPPWFETAPIRQSPARDPSILANSRTPPSPEDEEQALRHWALPAIVSRGVAQAQAGKGAWAPGPGHAHEAAGLVPMPEGMELGDSPN